MVIPLVGYRWIINNIFVFLDQECDAGQYLNMDTMKCEACRPGTYSSGNVAHYDDWNTLPAGFSITTESFQGFGDSSDDTVNCSKYDTISSICLCFTTVSCGRTCVRPMGITLSMASWASLYMLVFIEWNCNN